MEVNLASLFNPQVEKHGQSLYQHCLFKTEQQRTCSAPSNHFVYLPWDYTVKLGTTCLTSNIVKAGLCEKKLCKT